MKKNITLLILTLLLLLPIAAQAQPEALSLNPLTGTPVADATLLTYPPFLIPISRYPDEFRPSTGLSQAPWVFELYVNAGESRPYGLFYGAIPEAVDGIVPTLGALSSAILGTESLRRQYQAVLVTTGNSQHVVDAGIVNVENWYGEKGNERYPDLPISRLKAFMEKWKARLGEPDIAAITIPFSYAIPADGKAGTTVTIRYAKFNQVLWEFDPIDGAYHRSQNSTANPEIVRDMDVLTNEQITVQNVIMLFADHTMMDDGVNFTVNFNFVEKNPAVIFRDGIRYDVFWTTRSEAYERETKRMRPIRFIDAAGNPFELKPGKSWVHVLQINNPNYEIAESTGDQTAEGSGHWKFPYISLKPEESGLNPVP